MVEYEKKFLLTEEEYRRLLSKFPHDCKRIIQINYYFDTAEWVNYAQGITFRIREKNGTYTATEKRHQIGFPERSLEFSRPAKNAYDVEAFESENLIYQGALTTERVIWEMDNDIRICLDKNSFLGTVDYELEIEYAAFSKCENVWLCLVIQTIVGVDSLLEEKLLHCTEQGESKSSRFFKRKKEQQKRGSEYAVDS